MDITQERNDQDTPISNKERGATLVNFMDDKYIAQSNDLQFQEETSKTEIDNETPLITDFSPDKDLSEKLTNLSPFPSFQRQITGKLLKLLMQQTKYIIFCVEQLHPVLYSTIYLSHVQTS